MFESNIDYKTEIIKDGREYFYSPALQLISYIVNMPQTDCRFSYKLSNFLGGSIFVEKIIKQKTWFSAEKLADKEKIAELFYDINLDQITCRIPEEIKQASDSLKIPFFIFKGIRENDLFSFKTIERDVRHKAYVYYRATKSSLLKSQIDIDAADFVNYVSIPKTAFKRVVGSLVKAKRKKDGKDRKIVKK